MRTTCVRPGCSGSAAAAVLIDPGHMVVVLQPPDVGGPGSMVLCSRHVDRVSVPVGWEVRDLRGALVDLPVVDLPVEVPLDVPLDVIAVEAPLEAVALAVMLTEKETSLVVDDGATPLLGRAFRAASPGEMRGVVEPRGFAWLERGHGEVDGDPDGLREGVEHHR
jgi:hypothetical protein